MGIGYAFVYGITWEDSQTEDPDFCSMEFPLSGETVSSIQERAEEIPQREALWEVLKPLAGDFFKVVDFSAGFNGGETFIPWEKEESLELFADLLLR